MKKNFLQDVIPANHRRSIRDVPLPAHKEKSRSVQQESYKPTPSKKEREDFNQ